MSTTQGRSRAATVRIDGVQALRAAAALLVVVGHSQTSVAALAEQAHVAFVRWTILPWGAGVDLFFVISGFIMVYASQRLFGSGRGAAEFIRRRVVRVAPLYWLCTAAYLGIALLAHARGDPLSFSPRAVAASFLFVPYPSYGPSHGLFPVLDLGWTLNYEMFFYVLFMGTLVLPRRRGVLVVLAVLVLLAAGGLLLRPGGALGFWTEPVVLDFGLGVLVGQLRCEGVRWPPALRMAVLALGAAAFALDPLRLFTVPAGTTVANGLPRVLDAGLPAAAMLAAAVFGPDGPARRLGPAVALGDASYSLYLTHVFTLIILEKATVKAGLVTRIGPWPLVAISVAASLGGALLAFRVLETPMTRLAERLIRRQGDRAPLAAAPADAVPADPVAARFSPVLEISS